MRALSPDLRKRLESAVVEARRAAEGASRAAIEGLGVFVERRPAHLDADQAALRVGLRAKWRQLGGDRGLLVGECAYEQWHRLLFARFLAENRLLLHPDYKEPVTLAECGELAGELGEPDGWAVAARFAAEILPGIFRLDDPCVRLRLAPEGRHALEGILDGLPAEVFVADDALGWVYQYWQKDKKDEINASERKIGGADIGPVTQLFTENYMVRFLLENSLGAWWAGRHPDSPLVAGFEYLRFADDGTPAAGTFEGWPERVAEVTVMDPCCGSGHFLVEAFSMLWQMRVEEEGLSPVAAQDAVLRDNLFGLEIDPRCVEIAMFAVAFKAWKDGGGWRELPVPNIACSGIPVKAPVEEWTALAGGDPRLEEALVRLHALFRDADTLGSLIDPTGAVRSGRESRPLGAFDWCRLAPMLADATRRETVDPASAVWGIGAASIARAADLLSRCYTLIATNVPYLGRGKQDALLQNYSMRHFGTGANDLATTFLLRGEQMAAPTGALVVVCPQNWLFLKSYRLMREQLATASASLFVCRLGEHAFGSPSAAGAFVALCGITKERNRAGSFEIVAVGGANPSEKSLSLRQDPAVRPASAAWDSDTDGEGGTESLPSLAQYARAWQGLVTGDVNRYTVKFWEMADLGTEWRRIVTAPDRHGAYRGRTTLLRWEDGRGSLMREASAHNFNPNEVLGSRGVLIAQVRNLAATLYCGEAFNDASCPLVPFASEDLSAIWAYCSSPEYARDVRAANPSLVVRPGYLTRVAFDIDHWRQVAEQRGPIPEPWSDDPTQWLFGGRPEVSTASLQVAVARLVGYRWPEQEEPDDLDTLADADGIVCLPSLASEAQAVDRLQRVLAAAFGEAWSAGKARELLEQAASKKKDLGGWLRDEFFKQHCALFGNRPFIWHIWDGQRDGFSALVNYHRLDRKTLEKLTYTYLGQDWVERQRADAREEVPGADARLAAALELKRKLEAILEGEAPYDIYVRWKELHEQPIGWEPDLNDGVRLNIRPFVEAGVLRAKFNVHWRKDRGKNPDGSERLNDIHLTLAEKTAARQRASEA